MDEKKLRCVVEAILFVAGEALSIADLAHALDMTAAELIPVLDSLRDEYDREERGVRLNRFGMSVQLSTRPDYAPYIERKIVSLGSAVSEGEEDASLLGGAPSFCAAFRFDFGIKREKRGIMEHIEK